MKRYTQADIKKLCGLVDQLGYVGVHNKFGVSVCSLRMWKDPEYKKRCRNVTTKWIKNNPNYLKDWNNSNPNYSTIKNREWIENNKEKNRQMHVKSFGKLKANIEKYKQQIHKSIIYSKNRYQADEKYKKKCLISVAKYQKNNRHKIRKYRHNKLKEDINFRLLCNLRGRLYYALNGAKKHESAKDLVGCSIDYLKEHLERQFKDNMSWKNYGEWHIDHIVPCSAFNMLDEEDRHKCFHYKNLQPLWAEENFAKGDRI